MYFILTFLLFPRLDRTTDVRLLRRFSLEFPAPDRK